MDGRFSFFIAVRLIRNNWKAVIENYPISLIGEIWFDLQDKQLLENILLPLFVRFCLIYRINSYWEYPTFLIDEIQSDLQDMGLPNYPRPAFGPSGLGLRFGLMQRGLDIALGAPLFWAWRVGIRAHFSNPINFYIKSKIINRV